MSPITINVSVPPNLVMDVCGVHRCGSCPYDEADYPRHCLVMRINGMHTRITDAD